MVLNAQDLFLFLDKYQGEDPLELNETKWQLASSSLNANKPKEKCLQLANTILESNADVVMMTEVGGPESLNNFSKYVLKDQYLGISLPSNSDRGIDLGYLIKKNNLFEYQIHSYINFPLPDPTKKFSRDVLRLDIFNQGKLKLILLLVHIKSKLDIKKTDFEGRGQRALEIQALVNIYQELLRFKVPILIGGDFNGIAAETDTEEEFNPIYNETDLKDIAYLANIPTQERFSYIYFSRTGHRVQQQIDYLFLSDKYRHLIDPLECYFPRYKNLEGGPLVLPKKPEFKHILPSDHFPFLATIKIF